MPAPNISDLSKAGVEGDVLNRDRIAHISDIDYSGTPKHNVFVEIPGLPQAAPSKSMQSREPSKEMKFSKSDQPEVSIHVRSHTEVIRSSLQQFRNLLLAIFETYEALEQDMIAAPQSSEFFDFVDDEDRRYRISTSVLQKLQASAKYLVKNGVLKNISFDHLRRLQRLCEPAMERAQMTDLKIESDPSENELARWTSRVTDAENGLGSACVILWTVLADPHEMNMLPEDVIKWIPNVLLNTFENCLIPVVECRPDAKDQTFFQNARESRECLKGLLEAAQKLLDITSTICVEVSDAETAVNAIEYLSVKLIFVENAPTEKASVLGIQAYEKVRKTAMGSIAKIYARFPRERSTILREILHSLSKLPSTSRSARQYRTAEGKNIQLITAMMMQLVQTTMLPSSKHLIHSQVVNSGPTERDPLNSDEEDIDASSAMGIQMDATSLKQSPFEKLSFLTKDLFDGGAKSALEIVNEFVGKASITSKTSEDNYRNIFDLFVEDLLNVITLPEWPAAELLLKLIAQRLIGIATSSRTGASAKNMALENLGEMGASISRIQASLHQMAAGVAQENISRRTNMLKYLAEAQGQSGLRIQDLISLEGPFRTVHQYLQQGNTENLHYRSARGFCLTHWAILLCRSLHSTATLHRDQENEETKLDAEHEELVHLLLRQISEEDFRPLTEEQQVTLYECRLAYALILLNSGFCRRLAEIVKTLSTSFGSDQAQVRSRSIKSVVSILETDSSLLDRDVSIIEDVFAAASDESAMVRDSALSLIAKFIVTRPALQEQGIKCLLDCTSDAKVGVQKRSMSQLKEIYLRDDRPKLQAAIAAAFLRRLRDHEESVSDMALKLLTDIWILPYTSGPPSADATAIRSAIRRLADILLSTLVQNPDELELLLNLFLASVLKSEAKFLDRVQTLFGTIVSELFEIVITGPDDVSNDQKQSCLIILQLFARHAPRSVNPDQLHALRPYLGNLSKQDDLNAFRPVVAIFRLVLPYLPSTQKPLLQEVQDALLKSISRLRRRAELDEVTSCLWAIDGVLTNSERLVRLASSVLKPILEGKTPTAQAIQKANEADSAKLVAQLERQKSYIRIIGSIGKEWKLDHHLSSFQQKIPALKGDSVAGFAASVIRNFTRPEFTADLRSTAFESLGSICQGSPEQFKRSQVIDSFRSVFQGAQQEISPQIDLQKVVLRAFAEVMGSREEHKDEQIQDNEEGMQPVIEKLGGDSVTQEHDAAASQIAQSFFDDIVTAALGADIEKALIATSVLASINRQGLVHPKQCVGPLIALEVSPHKDISDLAYESHKMMHQQHESTYERQYLFAIREAFSYARKTIKDYAGASRHPFVAKLARCFEIVNTSSSKHVKKFLSVLVSATNVDYHKIDVSKEESEHLLFCCFVAQNLAFFDYARTDDLLHTILQIEIMFSKSGSDLLHGIEASLSLTTELLRPNETGADVMMVEEQLRPESIQNLPVVSDIRQLKQFATSASVLTIMWETRSFLKRQYGIQQDVRLAISQNKQAKTLDKPPGKLYAVTGDYYWNAVETSLSSLSGPEAMVARCRAFVELMSIDNEVKEAGTEDANREMLSASADMDEEAMKALIIGSGRGRKRKGTASVGGSVAGTPTKKKRGRPDLKDARRSSTSSKEDPDADYEG